MSRASACRERSELVTAAEDGADEGTRCSHSRSSPPVLTLGRHPRSSRSPSSHSPSRGGIGPRERFSPQNHRRPCCEARASVVVWWWIRSGPALRLGVIRAPVRRSCAACQTRLFPSLRRRSLESGSRLRASGPDTPSEEGSLSRSLAERGIQPCGGSLSLAVPVSLSNHVPKLSP
jgi:hypothetical protein